MRICIIQILFSQIGLFLGDLLHDFIRENNMYTQSRIWIIYAYACV